MFANNPADYENSWAYFRVLVMYTVLYRDHGVRYNPELVESDHRRDQPTYQFIYGVLEGKNGTCASLPPVFAAVGRRLGYPIKLVAGNSHLFARWEDRRERFNIECTSPGLNTFADDHYLTWPEKAKPADVEGFQMLRSMTPRDELALFLSQRGHILYNQGHSRQAVDAFAWSSCMAPQNKLYYGWLLNATRRWGRSVVEQTPQPFPEMTITFSQQRHYPNIPLDLEQKILYTAVRERLTQKQQL